MARAIGLLNLSLMLVVAWAWAGDASLQDPTLPPPMVIQARTAEASAEQVSLLQTVILRKGARPAAIIGGELVELGALYGEAKLVAVTEDSVILEGPGGRQTLRLFPVASKKPTEASSKRQSRGNSK